MQRRHFIAGNWKMHKTPAEAAALLQQLTAALTPLPKDVEVAVAPPFTALLEAARLLAGTDILLAAQNCHTAPSGAFTGEVSAPMLKAVGCTYVIVGHSERRLLFAETDAVVHDKVAAAQAAGLLPIICVGETLQQREAAETLDVIEAQVRACLPAVHTDKRAQAVFAYEPVWAIGTGKTATAQLAQEVHAHIRARLTDAWGKDTAQAVRIQYGGSVKQENAANLLSQKDIDGALVGGASLQAPDFVGIVKALA